MRFGEAFQVFEIEAGNVFKIYQRISTLGLLFKIDVLLLCFLSIPGRFKITSTPKADKTFFLVLEIDSVAAGDAGNYKVTAKNALGESNATIRLNFDSEFLQQLSPVCSVLHFYFLRLLSDFDVL